MVTGTIPRRRLLGGNGEIAYPVEEITIAGNLREMFKGITAVGNDVVVRGSRQSGSILIDGMTIAGA